MFDKKEIADRAIERAERIKKQRNRHKAVGNIGVLSGVCTIVAVIVIMNVTNITTITNIPTEPSVEPIHFEFNPIPLAAPLFPDAQAETYTGEGNSLSYSILGYDKITIPADTINVGIELINPEGNSCLFTFEIVLRDTEETLYRSGTVAPSMYVGNITLLRPLEKGEYKAVLNIRIYEPGSLSAMNKASVEFDIVAE